MFKKTEICEGVTLLTEYIPYVHSVSLGIWVKSGSIHDGEKTRGIAHFLEHMLFKGTEKRNAFEIAKAIDDVGGVLNAYTSKEYSNFYVKVLKEDLPLSVDIISDIFLNPIFPKDEMNREKGVVIQEIKMVEDTPDDYIHELLFAIMWGDHPLGHSILGELDAINSIDRKSLIKYRETYHTKENIIVAAVGNFEEKEIKELLSTSLNGIPEGRPGKIEPPKFIPKTYIKERDTEQVHISIAFPSLPYTHPKRYAQYILNTTIGGGMSSRLFQEVREKRGLAYAVYSFIASFENAGTLGFYAGTERKSVNELIEVSIAEMKKLTQIPLSEDELNSAKGQIKGNLILSMESSAARLSRMAKNEMYFARQITADEIIEKIDSVTAEEILEVAEEIIDLNKICAVLLGPISKKDMPPILS
jgi:predicted Zn-dependent peptidase